MKFINNKVHGILDFVTVVAFALIPTIFGLVGTPAYLSYVLAVVHLIMTLLTQFEFGLVKYLPLKFHKIVELIVGPLLLVIAWPLGFANDIQARTIFMVAGVVIILVGLFSNYHPVDHS